MGRHGGVVCAARVVMGPPPGLWRVHHTHTAVFSHATEVTSLRTTRTQGTVKRRYRVHTEPSLASNLCVTLPQVFQLVCQNHLSLGKHRVFFFCHMHPDDAHEFVKFHLKLYFVKINALQLDHEFSDVLMGEAAVSNELRPMLAGPCFIRRVE